MQGRLKDIFSRKAEQEEKERKHEDLYKTRKVPYKKDDMRLLEKLMKSFVFGKKNSGGSRFGGNSGGGWTNEKDQRVMFKTSHSDSLQVHQKYLRTYMPQEEKEQVIEKPELFGTLEAEYNEHIDGFHHKCIISPENQDVDLQLLAKEFIKRIEALTGYNLYWRGAIHTDTSHRHTHLCINGKDKNGRKVIFPKEMIKTTMRETLSYIATQMVGERTEREIEAARRGMTTSMRWTKLDDELEKLGEKISLHNLPPELQGRLAHLKEIGLADKSEKYWSLKKDWKDVLVSTGRYNTFFAEWQKSDGKLELYSGGAVSGVVESVVTFDKDEAWNDALIVKDGERLVYVPIWQLQKQNIVGKKVKISGGDRALSRQLRDKDIHVVDEAKRQNYKKRI